MTKDFTRDRLLKAEAEAWVLAHGRAVSAWTWNEAYELARNPVLSLLHFQVSAMLDEAWHTS